MAFRPVQSPVAPYQPISPLVSNILNMIAQRREQDRLRERQAEIDRIAAEDRARRQQAEDFTRELTLANLQQSIASQTPAAEAPGAVTAAQAGIPEIGPEEGGPPASQILVQQPDSAVSIKDPVSGKTFRIPLQYKEQVLANANAKAEEELRRRLGIKQAETDIETAAKIEQEKARGKRIDRTVDLGTVVEVHYTDGTIETKPKGAAPRAAGAGSATGLSDDRQARLTRILPEQGDWRAITASTPVIDSETSRGGSKAALQEWAADTGVLYPDKKSKEIVLAAKGDLADIDEIEKLMQDPDVRKDLGAWAGRLTNFLSKGWAGEGKVSAKTLRLRANLNQLAAKKRHEIYGAAVTGVEQGLAAGFIPAIDQSVDAAEANVAEFKDQIVRGLDARFGARRTTPEAVVDEDSLLKKYGY